MMLLGECILGGRNVIKIFSIILTLEYHNTCLLMLALYFILVYKLSICRNLSNKSGKCKIWHCIWYKNTMIYLPAKCSVHCLDLALNKSNKSSLTQKFDKSFKKPNVIGSGARKNTL